MTTPRRPFDRGARVATEVHQAIAQTCRERLDDRRFEHLEITHVRLTKDLRTAYVNFFIRTTTATQAECLEALHEIQGWMKQAIRERVSLKYMPELKFFFDETIERGERMHELFQQLDHKT